MKIQNVKITVCRSDIPIKGNAIASGDDEYDRNVENQIISDLECNVWAWCDITVSLELKIAGHVFKGKDIVAGCQYKDEHDFIKSGLFSEMVAVSFNDALMAIDEWQRISLFYRIL